MAQAQACEDTRSFRRVLLKRREVTENDIVALERAAYRFGVEQRQRMNATDATEEDIRFSIQVRVMLNDSRYDLDLEQRDRLFSAAHRGARLTNK